MKLENVFQASLIRTIKNLLPGCIVLKLDPNYIQGIPDLLILHGITWAALECKRSEDAPHQPNQDYYVDAMNTMSFATFVFPENVQQVLRDMVAYFNYINSLEFKSDEFESWKKSQNNLINLMSNYNYKEVAVA